MAVSRTLAERLLTRVVVTTSECWEWQGWRLPSGYGQISLGSPTHQRVGTHRASWMLHRGEIPDNTYVCHTCDNPPCINPDHLFLGSSSDNHQDMIRKGRDVAPSGEMHHASKLSEYDVLEIRRRYASGASSQNLARDYGVSRVNIYYIVSRTTWKHI